MFNPVYGQTPNLPVAQVVQSPSVRELSANGTVNRNDFSTNKQLKTDPAILYQRALNRMDLQDYRGAITDFNQVLKMESNNPYVYIGRGLGYFSLNEYQAAKADFDKALSIIPNIAYAHYFRGLTRYLLEDKEGAIADLQKASILFEQQGKIETVQKANEAIEKIQEELNSQYRKQLLFVMHLHRKMISIPI
ncbi:MAG: tetratricopeptide repeat protein [Trichormus sp. ATA11-4-KO1]|nr:tetratricopeptide repeat protein [Trichormus sp. ATA11-4-KO1]